MRIAINGFGRIGRHTFRNSILREIDNFEIVAVNDLADAQTLTHLLKYDSVHGPFPAEIYSQDNKIYVNGTPTLVLNCKSPAELPWKELGIDIVIESTGLFTSRDHFCALAGQRHPYRGTGCE
jgi:glyceraldehyde 3-phosphate dehydrogenase